VPRAAATAEAALVIVDACVTDAAEDLASILGLLRLHQSNKANDAQNENP
jgi:hypothetical protein